jgi:pseudouridine-5'-phosphate glycosidase
MVPIFGFGTDEFPAFYSRRSGLKVPHLEKAADAARVFAAHRKIGSGGGMLVTVPIPVEDEIDITGAIEEAVEDAKEAGTSGPEVTPWILSRVEQITQGRSVRANIALLKNNAAVGAKIARAVSLLTPGNTDPGA